MGGYGCTASGDINRIDSSCQTTSDNIPIFLVLMFFSTIGRLFEPYMIKALPSLLLCFGDGDTTVRQVSLFYFNNHVLGYSEIIFRLQKTLPEQ